MCVCTHTHAHTTVRMMCRWKLENDFVGSFLSVVLYLGMELRMPGSRGKPFTRQTVLQATSVWISSHTLKHLLTQVPILVDVKWLCGFDFQGPNNSKLCIFSCSALASYKFSLKKYLFRIFAHLENWVICLSTALFCDLKFFFFF